MAGERGPIARRTAAILPILLFAAVLAGCAARLEPPKIEALPEVEQPPIVQTRVQPDLDLFVCPKMRVSNAPAHDAASLKITSYKPFARVNNQVTLMTAPVKDSCLSSGFGERNGKDHNGLDFHSRSRVPIYSAGYGTIIESSYRAKDFGNMIVIDHGHGVYTRYAHLESIKDCVEEGAKVEPGSELGVMGQSGAAAFAIHLHYEVLTGDIQKAGSSFKLKAVDPFALEGMDGMITSASTGIQGTSCG